MLGAKLSDDSNIIPGSKEKISSGQQIGVMSAREDEQRVVHDEVDEELLPIFLEEANVLYPKISHALQAWRERSGTDIQLGDKLQRSLHTFKGSARMAGAMRLGELTHRIEGRIAEAIVQNCFDAALWHELENYLDRIGHAIEELADGEVAGNVTAAAVFQREAQTVTHQISQQESGEVCLVPFASVSERLYRVVRQTAKELNKRVNLELFGTGFELNRDVLEKMTAPLEHLLRNAIAHGIETPEQRERWGKPAIGEIRLSLYRDSNEIVFKLSDDGAGLDSARLQQKAVEHGLLHDGKKISEEQAIQMIFKLGLSTAPKITEISGRGIGLDVVKSEVAALGGRLEVVSTPKQGVSFTIRLPLTTV